jgi:hypothetical protein
MISSNYQIIIIIIIGIIIIFLLYNPPEKFNSLLAIKACEDVADILANTKNSVNNINAINITATETITLGDGANKWLLTPSTVDGKKQLIIAPLNASNIPDNTKQFAFYGNEDGIVTNNAMNIKNIVTENLAVSNMLTSKLMHNEGAITIGPTDNKWMWYTYNTDDDKWFGFSPVDEKSEPIKRNKMPRIFNFLRTKDQIWTNYKITPTPDAGVSTTWSWITY